MKKFLKFILVFSFLFNALNLNVYTNSIAQVKAQESAEIYMFVTKDNLPLMDQLTFEILDVENGNKISINSENSMVMASLEEGKAYILSLIGNSKYSFEPVRFIIESGLPKVGEDILEMLEVSEKLAVEAEITMIVSDSNNTPVLDSLTFEILDVETGNKISVNSESAMVMATLEDGKSYMISLVENSKYSYEPVSFTIKNGMPMVGDDLLEMLILNEKSTDVEDDPTDRINIDKITLNITKDDIPLENIDVNLFIWDNRLPNLVNRFTTDERGNIVVKNLAPNSKYELQVLNVNYKFDSGKVEFTTDENAMIKTINGKSVKSNEDSNVKIKAFEKSANNLETKLVKFLVLDRETRKPIPNVEITVNTVDPILKSYKRERSTENGEVVFELEGQVGGKIYTATISKNQQFLWDFTPEEITFSIDENLNLEYLTENTAFLITANDRTHLFDDLRVLIEKSEKLLQEKFKDENVVKLLKVKLQDLISGAKLELEKESIPYYIQGFVNEITTTIADLEKYKEETIISKKGESTFIELPISPIWKVLEQNLYLELPIAEIGKVASDTPFVELPISPIWKVLDQNLYLELPIAKIEKVSSNATNFELQLANADKDNEKQKSKKVSAENKKTLAKTGQGINLNVILVLLSILGIIGIKNFRKN